MIGARSGKVIGFKTISKKCGKCDRLRKQLSLEPNDAVPGYHDFVKNHDGSSKSMECQALLKMAISAKDRGFHIGCVVVDDDTTTKIFILEPTFLADFNHRVKSVGKAIYELAMKSKKESMVTKELARRIKYY